MRKAEGWCVHTQCVLWNTLHCGWNQSRRWLLPFRQPTCTSNLDHSMNFISNFSITITDIESKLGTLENKTETVSKKSTWVLALAWAAVQALREPSQPAYKNTLWVCNSHSLRLISVPLYTERWKPASNRSSISRQRIELPWEEKNPLITGTEGKGNCKAVTSITCQSSPLTAADRAAMQTCQINAFLVRCGLKTVW